MALVYSLCLQPALTPWHRVFTVVTDIKGTSAGVRGSASIDGDHSKQWNSSSQYTEGEEELLVGAWNFPGKNTEMGCHFLLQGIFLT